MTVCPSLDAIVMSYLLAKRSVIAAGYEDEISWQEQAGTQPLTEARFLSESAWVVLNAGFRESVVRARFGQIVEAFHGLRTAQDVVQDAANCRLRALASFNSPPKINAIVRICNHVNEVGFDGVTTLLVRDGVDYLRTLPFVGDITAWHLAKNLGQSVAKPDRHLCRIAAFFKCETVFELCSDVGTIVGDDPAVVDVVFWRFATLQRDYLSCLGAFADGSWSVEEPSERKSA